MGHIRYQNMYQIFFLRLLTPETIKLPGNTKDEIANEEYGKNISHLETAKVVLLSNVILSIMIINIIEESCIHLFQINNLESVVG